MKKILLLIGAVLLVGTSIFVACTREEDYLKSKNAHPKSLTFGNLLESGSLQIKGYDENNVLIKSFYLTHTPITSLGAYLTTHFAAGGGGHSLWSGTWSEGGNSSTFSLFFLPPTSGDHMNDLEIAIEIQSSDRILAVFGDQKIELLSHPTEITIDLLDPQYNDELLRILNWFANSANLMDVIQYPNYSGLTTTFNYELSKHFDYIDPNPFDFIGKRHNAGLDYIASVTDLDNLTSHDIYLASLAFEGLSEDDYTYGQYTECMMLTYINAEEGMQCGANMAYFSSDVEMKELLVRFRNVFIESAGDNSNPLLFEERIREIEKDILAKNIPLSDVSSNGVIILNDYGFILSMLSVARHSYSYWYEAFENSSHPWHDVVTKSVSKKGWAVWDWAKSAACWLADKAEYAVKGLATPFVDAYGFFSNVRLIGGGESTIGIPGTTIYGGFGFSGSSPFISGYNASADMWSNDWGWGKK